MDLKKDELKLTPDLFEKLDENEKNAETIAYESKTYFQDAWVRFKQHKLALAGLCFIIFMEMCIRDSLDVEKNYLVDV